MLMLILAWRNILRNRRRSLLTLLAVTFAALLSIAMRGMQVGTYAVNIQNVVRVFSGHCQVQRDGFQTNPSLQSSFLYDPPLIHSLSALPGVAAFAPRVIADGLAAYGQTSTGVMILGVDTDRERTVTTLLDRVRQGTPPRSGPGRSVVLGRTLAKNLGADVGHNVVLLAQGADGTLGNMRYEISGLVASGSPDLDRTIVIMPLNEAQALLAMEERVHAVALLVRDPENPGVPLSELRAALSGTGLVVLPWEELLPEFRQHIQMDNVSGILFLGILIIIVGFGILNTVLMSVTERTREFGVLLAMGMSPARLAVNVVLEGMLLGLAGILAGNLLAFGVNGYIVYHPIMIGGEMSSITEEYGFLPALYSSLRPHVFYNASLAILGITALSCLYPAYRVWNLTPIKGLRHT